VKVGGAHYEILYQKQQNIGGKMEYDWILRLSTTLPDTWGNK